MYTEEGLVSPHPNALAATPNAKSNSRAAQCARTKTAHPSCLFLFICAASAADLQKKQHKKARRAVHADVIRIV
jgi:hypothetical protein